MWLGPGQVGKGSVLCPASGFSSPSPPEGVAHARLARVSLAGVQLIPRRGGGGGEWHSQGL